MKINIYCNVTNQNFSVGYVAGYVNNDIYIAFNNYMASEITRLIVVAINDQRYKSKWKKLSEPYKKYKKYHGLSPNIWDATGTLKMNVSYDITGDVLLVGIDDYVRYEDGTRVIDVARWMEFGTINLPERPLFRPILIYVRKNIRYFYNRFLKSLNKKEEKSSPVGIKWGDTLLQEFVRKHNLSTSRDRYITKRRN